MTKQQAFLIGDSTVVFNSEDIEDIMNDIYKDWVAYGCRGTLQLPTVQLGTFYGNIDSYTNSPVGQFTTNRGDVFQVNEDHEIVLIAQSIA